MATRKIHVGKTSVTSRAKSKQKPIVFDSESEESGSNGDDEVQERLQGSGSENHTDDSDAEKTPDKSAMASVVARILSKDVSKSNRVLLAKGKTDKEVLKDILERKRLREEATDSKPKVKKKDAETPEQRSDHKAEKKRIWESMARKKPSVLDLPKETRLRKTATQGMVLLFRSVNEHQKVMNQKLASVGSSERKRDKVMAEFTKGKFLDMLKPKELKNSEKEEDSGKWKILRDDFMMGAQLKDWDKEEDDEGGEGSDGDIGDTQDQEEMMDADDMSDDE